MLSKIEKQTFLAIEGLLSIIWDEKQWALSELPEHATVGDRKRLLDVLDQVDVCEKAVQKLKTML